MNNRKRKRGNGVKKQAGEFLHRIYYQLEICRRLFISSGKSADTAMEELQNFWFKEYPEFEQKNQIKKQYDLMIIIPVYNMENYLNQCLDSVLNQRTQYSYCIVVVDDGSTDHSSQILEEYCGLDNIKIVHQENRGFSGARNRALEMIYGSYVMFLDSDDYLPENAIELLMGMAVKKDADIVYGGYELFSAEKILDTVTYTTECRRAEYTEVPGFTCMKVIRAEKLKNFCFPDGFLFEDTVLSKLVFPTCDIIYVIPDVVYYYRSHAKSISCQSSIRKDSIDTFWISKYCLEESVKRGHHLDEEEYVLYLHQCWVNYIRTRQFPQEIQESLFVSTSELLRNYFDRIKGRKLPSRRMRLLDRAIRKNSFSAYYYLMQRWELLG